MLHARPVASSIVAAGITGVVVWAVGPSLVGWLAVLAVGILVLVVTWLIERRRTPAPLPRELPPPTREELQAAIEESAWGKCRYRPESTWNAEEHRAFLFLYRRDTDAQGYRVTVTDPSGVPCETRSAAMAGDRLVALYPDDFDSAPPVVSGTYRVQWHALVRSPSGGIDLREVAADTFTVP